MIERIKKVLEKMNKEHPEAFGLIYFRLYDDGTGGFLYDDDEGHYHYIDNGLSIEKTIILWETEH